MKARIIAASLLFTATYAAPLSSPQLRVTPSEVDAMQAHDSGAGTSRVAGIRTTVVAGDPAQAGPEGPPQSSGWDVAGAKWFGYPTFWLNRQVSPAEELGAEADASGQDLNSLVQFVLDQASY